MQLFRTYFLWNTVRWRGKKSIIFFETRCCQKRESCCSVCSDFLPLLWKSVKPMYSRATWKVKRRGHFKRCSGRFGEKSRETAIGCRRRGISFSFYVKCKILWNPLDTFPTSSTLVTTINTLVATSTLVTTECTCNLKVCTKPKCVLCCCLPTCSELDLDVYLLLCLIFLRLWRFDQLLWNHNQSVYRALSQNLLLMQQLFHHNWFVLDEKPAAVIENSSCGQPLNLTVLSGKNSWFYYCRYIWLYCQNIDYIAKVFGFRT